MFETVGLTWNAALRAVVLAICLVLPAGAGALDMPSTTEEGADVVAVAELEEKGFRGYMEWRKSKMLDEAAPVEHPVIIDKESLSRAKRNIQSADWAKEWFEEQRSLADYLVSQPDGYVEEMISDVTPGNTYGFTCPNCVGKLSQVGTGISILEWDYRQPDVLRCKVCGQTYPDPRYPEEGRLECPRSGQTLTYYINTAEREHPGESSCDHAYVWVGHPMHVSFEGIIRFYKAAFMISGAEKLAYTYAITGDPRYAEMGARILARLAHCYRNWLYHDYWDAVADCDPLYAAWHDRSLPQDWKRHACPGAYKGDTVDKASMLQTYWGAGRFHPSTDAVSRLASLCTTYDLLCTARNADGALILNEQDRSAIERDLLLEWLMGAEPFLGGEGKAECHNNKSPRAYAAMAAVAKCLGIADFADTALRGYEALRDKSFLFDGFSYESPAYTNMYMGGIVQLAEMLQGFKWPDSYGKHSGVIDLYGTDTKLHMMLRAMIDQLDGTGRFLPLSDTQVDARPGRYIIEVGLARYPDDYGGKFRMLTAGASPSTYSVFNTDASEIEREEPVVLPEILYPGWMTAILRNGSGPQSSLAALAFNPTGGHRHKDNLSLYYLDRGATVLGDLGYVSDMPVNAWVHDTLSHNLVVVDDQPQEWERTPRFHLMATTPELSVVEASSDAYRQCSDYRRLVALVKGTENQTFAIDIFRVKGGREHSYQVFSQLASSDAPDGRLVFEGLEMPPEPPLPDVGQSMEREDIFGLRDIRTNSAPPSLWKASWVQSDRSYRLWMACGLDAVEASNGPGQLVRGKGGRRVRYLNAVRTGEDLESVFVAVHEPSGIGGAMPIKNVRRIRVPERAGPDAVALVIESEWGVYRVFSEFQGEAEVEGVRFQGKFGVLCEEPGGGRWALGVGASALKYGEFGFSGMPMEWRGKITSHTDNSLCADSSMPAEWAPVPQGCRSYVGIRGERYWTGLPVGRIEGERIFADRFPLPESAGEFQMPMLWFERAEQ